MESRQEILLGLSISLTGMFSVQGRQALDGLQLWQSYVNGRHGITIGQAGPQPIRLVFYDDQSRASLARENALRLLRQDREVLPAAIEDFIRGRTVVPQNFPLFVGDLGDGHGQAAGVGPKSASTEPAGGAGEGRADSHSRAWVY